MSLPTQSPHTAPSPTAVALRGAMIVTAFVALLWCIEAVDYVVPADLDGHGIQSRRLDGLSGIVFAPFLHVDFSHLAANTTPLLVLGILSAVRGLGRFFVATAVIIGLGGLGVWLTGPASPEVAPVVTIGASGLVFGYLGYLVGRGAFDRRLLDIVTAVIVLVVYGPMLWGVLPTRPDVSWQGHLFGLAAGILAAWMLRRAKLAGASRPMLPG